MACLWQSDRLWALMLDSQKFELPDIKPMVTLGIERILSSGYLATKIVPSIFKKPFLLGKTSFL